MAVQHKIRNAKGGVVEKTLTPRSAIRTFCIECMGFQIFEVPKCTAPLCPLYPFRMGDAHQMGEEQRKAVGEAARKRLEGESALPLGA